jgi:hypothetical protein
MEMMDVNAIIARRVLCPPQPIACRTLAHSISRAGHSHLLLQCHTKIGALPRCFKHCFYHRSWETPMITNVNVRRLGANEAAACADALADVLIDCVEGGASVSFMLPIAREKALEFWHNVADGVARCERILLVAEDGSGEIVGTVQLITAQPETSHIAQISQRCWSIARPVAAESRNA